MSSVFAPTEAAPFSTCFNNVTVFHFFFRGLPLNAITLILDLLWSKLTLSSSYVFADFYWCGLLILSLNCPEHLNVTTRLGASIILSPVAGFLPRLSRFSLTQNFPKPLIRTSSPDTRLDLISSRRVSTNSTDWTRGYPFAFATALIRCSFVRVIVKRFR